MPRSAGHDITYLAVTGALEAFAGPDGRPVRRSTCWATSEAAACCWPSASSPRCCPPARSPAEVQVVDAAIVDGVASMTAMHQAMRASGTVVGSAGRQPLRRRGPVLPVLPHQRRPLHGGRGHRAASSTPGCWRDSGCSTKAGLSRTGRSGPDLSALFERTFAQRSRAEWVGSSADGTPASLRCCPQRRRPTTPPRRARHVCRPGRPRCTRGARGRAPVLGRLPAGPAHPRSSQAGIPTRCWESSALPVRTTTFRPNGRVQWSRLGKLALLRAIATVEW